MVKQERAARTRAALVKAAAAEFDRNGYDGTSLARVSKAAGISMGALTFHFSSKGALADTVQEEGRALMRAALKQATSRPAPALQTVVTVSLALTGLVEEDIVARSAVRLVRERSEADFWTDIWLPTVRRLLEEASAHGQLRDDALAADVAALAEILTAGAEAHVRRLLDTGTRHGSATAQLERAWRLALAGVCAPAGAGKVPAAMARAQSQGPETGAMPCFAGCEHDGDEGGLGSR
ncbi:TetR family transcriptional regulator [Streptomyces avermitilis]